MRPNLSIAQKGLLLAGIPLLCETVFVILLLLSMGEAERVADSAIHSKQVMGTVGTFAGHFYDAATRLYAYKYLKSPESLEMYDHSLAKIPTDLENLKTLIGNNNPAEAEPVRRIEILSGDTISLLQSIRRKFVDKVTPLSLAETLDTPEKFTALVRQIGVECEKISEIERHSQSYVEQDKQQRRAQIRYIVFCGFALNLMIAVMMAKYFAREITGRISIMMDNSARLTAGGDLNPPVDGSDEISSLDRTFHDMARALREAARVKQEFVAMISHDLRSPLTAIFHTLNLLSMGVFGGSLQPEAQKRVAMAEDSAERLISMINDLLDIERLDSGGFPLHVAQWDTAVIVKKSINAVESLAEGKGITITSDCQPCTIIADGSRLIQIIVNLLGNAIKFSPDSSTIAITACLQADDSYVSKSAWRVSIADKGRGIPADKLPDIFNRFSQVSLSDATEKGGSGLGLAICKALVEAHHGRIWAVSKEGEGSEFIFTVPADSYAGSSAGNGSNEKDTATLDESEKDATITLDSADTNVTSGTGSKHG